MPETPNYYLIKDRRDDAIESLRWLRIGASDDAIEEEMANIHIDIDSLKQNEGKIMDLFAYRTNSMALVIVMGVLFFMQASGIDVVLFFCQTIFQKSGSSLQPDYAAIIIATVQMLSSFTALFIVDRLGRKPLLLFSAGGMTISLVNQIFLIYCEYY